MSSARLVLLLLLLSNVAVMWVFHSQQQAIIAVLAFAKSIRGRKTLFDPDFDPKTSNPSACSIGGTVYLCIQVPGLTCL